MEQNSFFDIAKWDNKCMQAFIKENAAVFRVFALRYIADTDVVDDLLQEAYMKFWLQREKIGIVKSPRNYFFSIIKNTIIDKRNYFSRKSDEQIGENGTDISDEGAFLLNMLEAESSALIAKAIMQLSAQSQKVILMTLEEQRIQDIAKTLGVSINTVKTIKYRALKRLSGMLAREDFFFMLLFCYISSK